MLLLTFLTVPVLFYILCGEHCGVISFIYYEVERKLRSLV